MAGELALQAGLIGFMLGLPGIFSIGPQNLRVLNAGLTAAHPGAVATTAFLSAILLVAAGIGGLGLSLATDPTPSHCCRPRVRPSLPGGASARCAERKGAAR